jgi:hypothetical protein
MKYILQIISFSILIVGCGTSKSATKPKEPLILTANKILFVLVAMDEVADPFVGFFGTCDSIFKLRKIERAITVLSIVELEDQDKTRHKLTKVAKQLMPDCIIFLVPTSQSRGYENTVTVKYDISIMPVNYAQFLGIDKSGDRAKKYSIGSFTFFSTGKKEMDLKNGQKGANTFIQLLKNHIVSLSDSTTVLN